jgi:hypothetical protein
MEKAELLVKMSIPEDWDQGENIESKYIMIDDDHDTEKQTSIKTEKDLLKRMKSIRKFQASKGAIKNFGDASTKEIFNSSTASVLACLQ